ncbi:citrate synthase/methylcitrate synthase [Sulfuracidifex metallicus]|uniref:citrate synthase/methylcitrate synthase n=1 Tax=Sulfuracidifex metallicus TaxID=47303 RepID=UPI0022762AA9|nr:citrate synthase/methylcitrate synthase [Sulfuracidifex metallicus]MCY0850637.1 citrate synthase/methylcitrate synthase [Sulfuracidifex metallicus]
MDVLKKGLEDIAVKETSITYIDGKMGRLFYRGYSIFDLAEFSSFEEVAFLLWKNKLPNMRELESFKKTMSEHRDLPDQVMEYLTNVDPSSNPMDVLRTAVSMIGTADTSQDDIMTKSIKLTSKIPTLITAFQRIRSGEQPIPPDPSLSHASNFLYMLSGEKPTEIEERAMDVALVLHADHEMNASTFACLVIASTLSDIYSSVIGGISALKGPLHGAANSEALKMFLEIGSPENVEEYVYKRLSRKERLMGFGHRIYKTYDPRAIILRSYADKVTKLKGNHHLYEIARKVEDLAVRTLGEKGIYPNVDFYSGLVFYSLGFSPEFFPTVFASSRVVGWTAQAMEYLNDNRLIRPKAIYVGDVEKPYVPIEDRS